MHKLSSVIVFCVLLLTLILLSSARDVWAHPLQQSQPTPSELINAVNALRLSYGLPPLKVNSILTQTAQNQANALLASKGAVGHTRPGGITYTEQLILLGYPLAGDLTLGGFRSENYVFGHGLAVPDVIQIWLGDEPHTNTMLSPNYLDIGAGIAMGSDGAIYFVIDCARPTPNGLPQSDASTILLTGTAVSQSQALSQYIIPVSMNTAHPDGLVYHKVQYGQSLWSVAIAYHTTINDLRTLNNISSTTVYEGQVLLVHRAATQPASSSATMGNAPPQTPTVISTPAMQNAPPSPTVTALPNATDASTTASENNSSPGIWVAIVMVIILVGVVTAVFSIRSQT